MRARGHRFAPVGKAGDRHCAVNTAPMETLLAAAAASRPSQPPDGSISDRSRSGPPLAEESSPVRDGGTQLAADQKLISPLFPAESPATEAPAARRARLAQPQRFNFGKNTNEELHAIRALQFSWETPPRASVPLSVSSTPLAVTDHHTCSRSATGRQPVIPTLLQRTARHNGRDRYHPEARRDAELGVRCREARAEPRQRQ